MSSEIGVELASRSLDFIWIADCSGSMNEAGKIQALNTAIRDAIPEMRAAADDNPESQLFVRAVKFADGAQWHVADRVPINDFEWPDLEADGVTSLGKALSLVAAALDRKNMPRRALPPVLALITDGMPTDDWEKGLRQLTSMPWGKKAVRVGIAIGAQADHDVIAKFLSQELRVLQANNAHQLVNYIRWVSTEVVSQIMAPDSQVEGRGQQLNLPAPIPSEDDDEDLDKW